MHDNRKQIRVLVAVRNNILCEGLLKIISETPLYKAFCLTCVDTHTVPDIVLFDANQDLQSLQARYPKAKPILIDTGLKERKITCLLACHKIFGVITPDSSLELFFKAIRVVNRGDIWIDQRHLKSLLHRNGSLPLDGDIKILSRQDKKIVQLITQGYKNREIGDKLCLSEHTIKAHVSRIFKRMNVNNRSQLVCLAKDYNSELIYDHP